MECCQYFGFDGKVQLKHWVLSQSDMVNLLNQIERDKGKVLRLEKIDRGVFVSMGPEPGGSWDVRQAYDAFSDFIHDFGKDVKIYVIAEYDEDGRTIT